MKDRGIQAENDARARKSYIWRIGIVEFALPLFLLNTFWDIYGSGDYPKTRAEMMVRIGLGLVVSVVAGIVYGRYMWQRSQRKA